ncbi:MAG TPA: HAMP domain-containing sensor histidine kinase [Pirellulales bacterium]|nr:HAMP domain-containing sensor histidine kinase [Pirellulales bacterium]
MEGQSNRATAHSVPPSLDPSISPSLQHALEREKLEALAEFAAGAGHEMNNPLAVIAGRAQLLLRDETDPQRQRDLAVIHAQALRVVEMISDLMLFARPPAPQRKVCDVAAIINRVADEVAPRAHDRQVRLVRPTIDDSLRANIDEVQIAVALRAVCDNALHALGRGGVLAMDARQFEDRVEIAISDDGPGFSPEARRHAFDPFYSGRSAGRGLGTGLSKCWRIATNHGGSVAIDSAPGKGTTVTVVIPAA